MVEIGERDEKVYAWELRFPQHLLDSNLTLVKIKEMVQEIWNRHEQKCRHGAGNCPFPLPPTVHGAHPKHPKTPLANARHIYLPPGTRSLLTVMHELTHSLVDVKNALLGMERTTHHGADFVNFFMRLCKRELDVSYKDMNRWGEEEGVFEL